MWLGEAIYRRPRMLGVSRAYVVLGDIPAEIVETNTERHERIAAAERSET